MEKKAKKVSFELGEAMLELKEAEKELELAKLAKSGNIFAKYQQNFERTGLPVNLEALFEKKCKHGVVLPNGAIIGLRIAVATQNKEGFQIKAVICPICGKTLQIAIYKPKQPRRLEE